jgi:heme-degrading monooxygenase HmoA
MIARAWRGRSTVADGPRYVEHLEQSVFPQLEQLDGHQSAYLLQRTVGGDVEFLVITLWDSLDVIRQFAGDDVGTAVVEPAARALLSDFDEHVDHYEVALPRAKTLGASSQPKVKT